MLTGSSGEGVPVSETVNSNVEGLPGPTPWVTLEIATAGSASWPIATLGGQGFHIRLGVFAFHGADVGGPGADRGKRRGDGPLGQGLDLDDGTSGTPSVPATGWASIAWSTAAMTADVPATRIGADRSDSPAALSRRLEQRLVLAWRRRG